LGRAHGHDRSDFPRNLSGAQKIISAGKKIFRPESLLSFPFREKLLIGGIESLEITFTIGLFFTGSEREKDAVGMVLADILKTVPE
jgi:hypothetical protein